MSVLRGWRPALRIARREALRARGRSVLVLVMIALPVTGVVAMDTLIRTADVSGTERLDRDLGAADALVRFEGIRGNVEQSPALETYTWGGGERPPVASAASVRAALGSDIELLERRVGQVSVTTEAGVATNEATEVDLASPLTAGLFPLVSGRVPETADEVVVSERLAERGFPVGAELTLGKGGSPTVVGIVESAEYSDTALVVGPLGSLDLPTPRTSGEYLVDKPGGVSWSDVLAANQAQMLVLSRQVAENPPPEAQAVLDEMQGSGDAEAMTVIALIVAMALLEVVLLAGPAFAVGARRQQRSLALMAATGGTARDVRRTVLASGVVLGGAAALLGVVLGVGAAWAASPVVQRFTTTRFGPFEVSVRDLALIALFGLVSAVIAAVAPARLAARLDVVAVLAGRRGEGKPRLRSPLLGVVLLGLGSAGAVYGATGQGSAETVIAGATILSVLGMVLLVPVVVAGAARLTRRLPLALRYAVRDAARHRSRTTPAVAAVAATVVGVVALGIASTSDNAENRATYSPGGPEGIGVVTSWARQADWETIRSAVLREAPGAALSEVEGIPEGPRSQISVAPPEGRSMASYSTSFGTSILVSDGSLDHLGMDLSAEDTADAEAMLADGGAVVFQTGPEGRSTARVKVLGSGGTKRATVPAVYVVQNGWNQLAAAVVSPEVVEELGVETSVTALLVGGPTLDESSEQDISEALAAISNKYSIFVERGFSDDDALIMLLVLAAVGGMLMLGGTLTATFLALSDARPDLATLASVGADPGTRRTVAAAYAGTIGLIGAVLGAAVGFIPGIAVSFPLTNTSYMDVEGMANLPSHYLDIPWLLIIGVVVLLPLLTALIVGLTSRSRLPMVARLS